MFSFSSAVLGQYEATYTLTSPNKEGESTTTHFIYDGDVLKETMDSDYFKVVNYYFVNDVKEAKHFYAKEIKGIENNYIHAPLDEYVKCLMGEDRFSVVKDTLGYDYISISQVNPSKHIGVNISDEHDAPFLSMTVLNLGLINLPNRITMVEEDYTITAELTHFSNYEGSVKVPPYDELGVEISIEDFCKKKVE